MSSSITPEIPTYSAVEQLKLHVEKPHSVNIPSDTTITVNVEESVKPVPNDPPRHPVVLIESSGLRGVLRLYDYQYQLTRLSSGFSTKAPWSIDREAQVFQFMHTSFGRQLFGNTSPEQLGVADEEPWLPMPWWKAEKLRKELPEQISKPLIEESADSYSLDDLHLSPIPVERWGGVAGKALNIVNSYGKHGVLSRNHWLRLQGFLVRHDHSAVLVDFALCKFDEDYETWTDWMLKKAHTREVTLVYRRLQRLMGQSGGGDLSYECKNMWGRYVADSRLSIFDCDWFYLPLGPLKIEEHSLKPQLGVPAVLRRLKGWSE
ncbi:MAG: hypothetical protein MMC33_008314 [Icmadophila ericetorum]|nr:hypothetical protein [Icmadophila ericetorum]